MQGLGFGLGVQSSGFRVSGVELLDLGCRVCGAPGTGVGWACRAVCRV